MTLSFNCSPGNSNTASENLTSKADLSNQTKVRTTILTNRVFAYKIETNGKIRSYLQQTIFSQISGEVVSVSAANGDLVNSGAVIVKLDTRAIMLKLQKAKDEIFNATVNYKSELLSQGELLVNKSSQTRDTVIHKLRLNSGLNAAELTNQELSLELEKSTFKAPFLGKVVNLKVSSGMSIKTGDELFTIYSPSHLYVEIKILESDVLSLKKGQNAIVNTNISSERHPAKVEEINPFVDENGLVLVKIRVLGTENLMPGMNADVQISIPQRNSLYVPKQAIVMRSNKPVVFIAKDNQAIWNYVVLGNDNGQEVEVRNGLKPGQHVIITNNLQLNNESPINEINK